MEHLASSVMRAPWFTVVVLAFGGCTLLAQPVGLVQRRGPVTTSAAEPLRADVERLAVPRSVDDVVALDAAADFLRERLRQLGYQPEDQTYTLNGKTYRNLRAVAGNPRRARVVVGAHYDSCGPRPAADDNASGVAVVLELARLWRENAPTEPVEFVFWTLEEPPVFATEFMGSVVHAKALVASGVRVKAALSIETVGYYRDQPGTQRFPVPGLGLLYSTTGNSIALISNVDNTALVRTVKQAMRSTESLEVLSMNAPGLVPGVAWSDHRSYWPFGVPSLMVTDTARFRNPNYHQATDTPDTLDYPRMAALCGALFEAVWVLAQGP